VGAEPNGAALERDGEGVLRASGDWVLDNVATLAERVERVVDDPPDGSAGHRLDFSGITRLDASGALLLERLLCRSGRDTTETGLPSRWQRLFEAVDRACDDAHEPQPSREPQWRSVLARVGRSVVALAADSRELLGFLGLTVHRLFAVIVSPRRLRLTSVVYHMEQTGLDAAPLLMLLASLVGAVIAFLGATVLADFGAELFVVDLVAFAFVREFGVLLAAVLLAGRTASAFCAQIGMMKAREEVDAIRTLGLDEIEVLVVPRVIALVITLPLLTFLAVLAGLTGGLVVSVLSLDLNLQMFIERVQQTLTLHHYLVGMLKAPVFAFVIALIGCLEGLRVSGTAQSVGEHTTIAVVRSITIVIVLDALAAVFFQEIGW
jgi:phospholipid/cholesterol/gamma-HCH transport system permease protein